MSAGSFLLKNASGERMVRKQANVPEDPFSGLPGGTSAGTFGASSAWTGLDVAVMGRMIEAVTARGDGIVIGTTSDGGAMSLMILSGGAKRRFYESDAAVMNDLLEKVALWAENR